MNPERTREIALALTSFLSVTDSPGETRFGPFLRDMLAAWPYFRAHPERLRLLRTIDDSVERYVLAAVVMPKNHQASAARLGAVVLTGHYDVVSTANYGELEGLAFDADALAPRLVEALEAEKAQAVARGGSLGRTEERALEDLRSGAFLPGRGLLDMKAGLAAGLALLEDFAAGAVEAPGAMLFLTVPDEEGASHGMLSAVRLLPPLLEEWSLRPVLAINLDAAVDQGPGENGRAVFLGSVGKLHPFVLFVGRPSHAGAPFDGINPALLAAEYAREIECSSDLFGAGAAGASVGGAGPSEPPPPPTILYHRDLRDRYDVTMPSSVFVSANLLSNDRGPSEVLAMVSHIASKAMESGLALLRARAASFSERSGSSFAVPDRGPRVIAWAELEVLAREKAGAAFEAARASACASADRMAALAELADEAARLAGIEGPAAVVGLAPPYYPRAALDPERDAAILGLVEREARAFGESGFGRVTLRPAFPGISDMSFLYPMDDPQSRRAAAAACPLGLDPLPSGFSCPAVNIGPWGREYHQRLERVHAEYAFEALPELLRRVTLAILESSHT